MRIAVFPRDRNPYQRLLYGEMTKWGVAIRYLGERTRSHTVNVLLLPADVVAARLAGATILHVHWMYRFVLPAPPAQGEGGRRVMQLWAWLLPRWARLLGMTVVWTAHNALPHDRIFGDDRAARRQLVAACDLVLAHDAAVLRELAAFGARPKRSAIVSQGAYVGQYPPGAGRDAARAALGAGPQNVVMLFFGRIAAYKGVEDLLAAVDKAVASGQVVLRIVGECPDPSLRRRIESLAAVYGPAVRLEFRHAPDVEVADLFAAADVVVLPFRSVSNSGSALLAMTFGRPVVVPHLAAFDEFPAQACVRYDGTVEDLRAALAGLTEPGAATALAARAEGPAFAFAEARSWRRCAKETYAALSSAR
jgi:glycosyltransferase involved in cell wall biosynthesis